MHILILTLYIIAVSGVAAIEFYRYRNFIKNLNSPFKLSKEKELRAVENKRLIKNCQKHILK